MCKDSTVEGHAIRGLNAGRTIVDAVLGQINDIVPNAALRDISNIKITGLPGIDIADAVGILSDFGRVMVAFLMNIGVASGSSLSDDCVIAVADMGNIGDRKST